MRTQRIPGSRAQFGVDRNAQWLESAWIATVVAAILFNPIVGPLTPLIIFATLPAFLLLRIKHVPQWLGKCWPLLLLPAFAMASTAWSDMPSATARYSFIFLVTVLVGMAIGGLTRRVALLKGLFIGFAIYAVLTVVNGQFTAWNGPGGLAFRGIAGSKNSAGDTAGLTIIVTLVMLAWAIYNRSWGYVAAALAVVPFALFALWFSKATAALMATIGASAWLLILLFSRSLTAQIRVSIAIVATLLLFVAILSSSLWLPALFDAMLEGAGKDADLTGRVDLWRKADSLITSRPWLGMGYESFWHHGNLDAEYLWRMMGIGSRMGFNFHNTVLEIVVHLGYVGLTLFGIVAAAGVARLLIHTIIDSRFSSILMCTLIVFFLPKLQFEVVGFGTMHFGTIIIFAALAYGYSADLVKRQPSTGLRAAV